jgi:hypothetical protein
VQKSIATAPAAGTTSTSPPAPVVVPNTPPPTPAVVPSTPPASFAAVPENTAPRTTPSVPTAETLEPLPPAPKAQTAAVPAIKTEPATTKPAAAFTPAKSRADILRDLNARFSRAPFKVEHLDRNQGQMVVTYDGTLAGYVACGQTIGAVAGTQMAEATSNNSDHLNSRIIIRLVGGDDGSTSISADALHVVSMMQRASRTPSVVDVRLDKPARTGDGGYCWSTGAMERLAQVK